MTHPSSPPAPMTAERLYEVREQYRSGRWGDGLPRELFGHIDALTARVAELERRARFVDEAVTAARKMIEDAHAKTVGEMATELQSLQAELAAARGAFDLSESERQRLAGRINATEARKVEDGDVQDAVDWLRDRAECSSITLDPAPMGPIADLLTRLSAALKEAEAKLETIRRALFPDPEHHITHHARYNLEGALADLEAGQNDPTVRRTLKRVAGQIAAAERALQTKDTTP